ncbi:hypothetical protein [Streptomyces sp. G-G2]|uniref:hypothetical protein n=1 Tax=Streptomyces sp. G-G2 TaxID=3046201 RepID=UPI0024B953F3|nr:hypothetical protein [Streptomyces sp. G-G2]MDJ0381087.1 hypothetical protein [Streptomyces sp. G-G2]
MPVPVPTGSGTCSLAAPVRTREIMAAAGSEQVDAVRGEAYGKGGEDGRDAAGFLLGSGPGHHLMGRVDQGSRERARRKPAGSPPGSCAPPKETARSGSAARRGWSP